MRIAISTTIDRPAEDIWPRVLSTEFILGMSDPYLRYELRSPSPTPPHFADGQRYRMVAKLLGWLPTERTDVVAHVSVDKESEIFEIRNVATGWPTCWDHRIRLTAQPNGLTKVDDQIDVEAGLMTPAVGAFVRFIFAQRQKNWQAHFRGVTK